MKLCGKGWERIGEKECAQWVFSNQLEGTLRPEGHNWLHLPARHGPFTCLWQYISHGQSKVVTWKSSYPPVLGTVLDTCCFCLLRNYFLMLLLLLIIANKTPPFLDCFGEAGCLPQHFVLILLPLGNMSTYTGSKCRTQSLILVAQPVKCKERICSSNRLEKTLL